jgi:hypothetical protein
MIVLVVLLWVCGIMPGSCVKDWSNGKTPC